MKIQYVPVSATTFLFFLIELSSGGKIIPEIKGVAGRRERMFKLAAIIQKTFSTKYTRRLWR